MIPKLPVQAFVILSQLVTVFLSLIEGNTSSEQSLSPLNSSNLAISFICPEQFGYFDDKLDCTKYFVCVFGEALHETCTGGLYFSAELQTCDWPRNVLCTKKNQNKTFDGLDKRSEEIDASYQDPLDIRELHLNDPTLNSERNEKDKEEENLDLQRSRTTLNKNFVSKSDTASSDFNYIEYNRNSAPIGRSISGTPSINIVSSNENSNFNQSSVNAFNNIFNLDNEPPQPSYDESYSSVVDSNGGIYLADGKGGLVTINEQLPGVLNLGESEDKNSSKKKSSKRDQARLNEERLSDSRLTVNQHSRNAKYLRKAVPHFQMQHFQQEQHFKRMQQPSLLTILNVNKNQDQEVKLKEGNDVENKRRNFNAIPFKEFSSMAGNSEIIILPVINEEHSIPNSPRTRIRNSNSNLQYNPSFVEYMDENAGENIFFDDEKVIEPFNHPVSPPKSLPILINRATPPRAAVRSRYPAVPRVNHQRHFRPFIPPYSGFEERRIIEPVVFRHQIQKSNERLELMDKGSFKEKSEGLKENANTTPSLQHERNGLLLTAQTQPTLRSNNSKNQTLVVESRSFVDNKILNENKNFSPNHQTNHNRNVVFQNPSQTFSQNNKNRTHLSLINHGQARHQTSNNKPVRGSGVPSEHGQPFGLVDYDDELLSNSRETSPAFQPTQKPNTILTEYQTTLRPETLPIFSTTPLPIETRSSRKPKPNEKRSSKLKTNASLVLPSRPLNLYPTPIPLEIASKCMPQNCVLPDCNCGSSQIPGGLNRNQVPQIVLITFDDAVNDLNWDIYEEIFNNKRKNPNQCPLLGTFYVSHEWTDYGQVQTLYSRGHEIASHGITHSFGEKFSNSQWHKEIQGQREILHLYGNVKLEDVRGMRAPFLQIGGNKMFEMLYNYNFTYDSSMPVFDNKPPFWPYTLDYAINHECMIAPCPSQSFPGIWEVGMVMWEDLKGGRCSMGDACSNPTDENGVYTMLLKNFKRHYNSNRAPFGLFYHSAWFNTPHHRKGFIKFIDEILGYGDVYFTTNWQMLQWVRNPTPMSSLDKFEPWDCKKLVKQRPRACSHPTVCNVRGKNGHRYMKTCQSCPNFYPWLGKTGL